MEFSRQEYWGGLPFLSPEINEEEIGKLPGKEFRIMIAKMIKKQNGEMQESVNKDLEELKNKRTETNNTITEIKKYSRRNQ